MAENETAAVAEQYNVTVEGTGPTNKKVSVEIPAEVIKAKLAESMKELRQKANIPGFRVGHAPAKLIEKKFGKDIRDDVRRALITESYESAVDKNSLKVLGEPEFDNPDAIKLPEDGSAMSYSFTVEVQPEIPLPTLEGLAIKKTKIGVTEANVDQAMQNLREQQGTLVPVEDRGVEAKDCLVVDARITAGETELADRKDMNLVCKPTNLAGVPVDNLPEQLAGMKPGESRTFTTKIPGTFSNEELRDKDATFNITVKEIKKLDLAELNTEFLSNLGFASEQSLREALKEQMVERIENDVRQSMRDQAAKYLLDNTQFELPQKLSEKQEHRVIERRAMNLLQRGVPKEVIEPQLDLLKSGAKEEGINELKLFFILQKVAEDYGVEVDEPMLNNRIAAISMMQDARPEKLKQDMSKDGRLQTLYIQMREQLALDKIIESAKIEEVEPTIEKKD